MQFPVPSETFASNDVRTFGRLGLGVTVHTLKGQHPDAARLAKERGLEDTKVTHGGSRSLARGLRAVFARPGWAVALLGWILRTNFREPDHMLKSLLLLPRACEIALRLERERPDIVHLAWGHYPALVGYLVLRYLPNAKLTMSLIAYDLHMRYGGTGWVARRAAGVRTLTRENVGTITSVFKVPADRVTIIYDSVDVKRVEPALRDTSKVPGRLLTAGRLIEAKGIAEVLEVFSQVRAQHPWATLRVLGDGPQRAVLEAKTEALGIAPTVAFLGHVSHEQVFAEMAQAEVFVFMSWSERLPNVVKEAMLSRCVVVASDTVGIREIIPDPSFGFVVPVRDVAAATRATLEALEPSFATAALPEKARAHILEHFSLEVAMEQYLAWWRGLLSNR